MMPGVEVFGTPPTDGTSMGGGAKLDPVVKLVEGDELNSEFESGIAPRLEPAGPLVPPAVCA
jgi:hypothetical protein